MKIICSPNAKMKKAFVTKWKMVYGLRCAYCCEDCSNFPTIDHLLPRSKGGGNRLENLVLACSKCNSEKGDKLPEEYKVPVLQPLRRSNEL